VKMLQTLITGAAALAITGVASAATVDEVIDRIVGHYKEGETYLHAAQVPIGYTDDAVYVELIARGQETQVRQMILTFSEHEGDVTARVNVYDEEIGQEFVQDLRVLTLGLWAAPDLFPSLTPSQLDPIADAPVEISGDEVRIAFTNAPAVVSGSHVVDADLRFTGDEVKWKRSGRDVDGASVWDENTVFDRTEVDDPVRRFDNGLVTIDIREGQGVALAEGDQIAFDYVGVLQDGRRFDSTQFTGRSMYASAFPGGIHPEMAKGLVGIECPTAINDDNLIFQPIRKIILPPDIAFGEEGRGFIPPNATLYYLAMVQSVRDRTPDTE